MSHVGSVVVLPVNRLASVRFDRHESHAMILVRHTLSLKGSSGRKRILNSTMRSRPLTQKTWQAYACCHGVHRHSA